MKFNCKSRLTSEFTLRNLYLDHNNPATFVQFQFGAKSFYIIWRILGVCISIGLVASSLALTSTSDHVIHTWASYPANWSLLLLVVSAVVDVSASLYTQIKRKDLLLGRCTVMPRYLKCVWLVHNIAVSAALSISLLYWTVVYTGEQTAEGNKIVPYLSHVLNPVYVTSVVLVTGIPTRLLHAYQALLYSVIYVVFSIIYRGSEEDTNTYYFLDWSQPSKAWPSAIMFISASILCHCAVYFMFCVREFMTSNVCRTNSANGGRGIEYIEFSGGPQVITTGDLNARRITTFVPVNLLDTIT